MSKSRRHRSRLKIQRRSPPGSAPGLVMTRDDSRPSQISAIAYDGERWTERSPVDLSELPALVEQHAVTWINVDGLRDTQLIEELGETFELHRLALEDAVNTHQRPKVDDYENHLFIALRMADIHGGATTEQLSMFLGHKFVITIQEEPGDCWQPVRERLRQPKTRLRQLGADYLAYTLIDAVIDDYFPALERYGEALDDLEIAVLNQPQPASMDRIHAMKGDLLLLRRAIWPLREAMAELIREHTALVQDTTRIYLRDCYDHVVQVLDLLDVYRELTADLRDLYMTSVSNRINETMRVLTIIATIFIPVTFIAGVFGMNFDFMPELHWRWGYAGCWGVMLATAAGMLVFFFRQGWLSPAPKGPPRPAPDQGEK